MVAAANRLPGGPATWSGISPLAPNSASPVTKHTCHHQASARALMLARCQQNAAFCAMRLLSDGVCDQARACVGRHTAKGDFATVVVEGPGWCSTLRVPVHEFGAIAVGCQHALQDTAARTTQTECEYTR